MRPPAANRGPDGGRPRRSAEEGGSRTAVRAAADMGDVGTWQGAAPEIDPDRILRVHRYSDPAKVRPKIREAAARVAGEVQALARPQAAYRRVAIEACAGETLTLAGGTVFHCAAFERLLKDCGHVVAFVLTLGPALDARVIELMDEFEPLDALFVETAGWLGIETATRRLAADLGRTLAAEGLVPGRRMGPGYSYRHEPREAERRVGWPLEEQAGLFALFGDAPLPVELLPSAAMKPKMSRSGLFGAAVAGDRG